MKKPGRDNFAHMSLHGKLTVQKKAKVAKHSRVVSLECYILVLMILSGGSCCGRCREPNQINSVLSGFIWSLRAVHHS